MKLKLHHLQLQNNIICHFPNWQKYFISTWYDDRSWHARKIEILHTDMGHWLQHSIIQNIYKCLLKWHKKMWILIYNLNLLTFGATGNYSQNSDVGMDFHLPKERHT